MTIEWKDPPRRTNWAAVAAALRDAPGRWALVATKDTMGQAQSVTQGLRKYGVVTTSRHEADHYCIYAQWPKDGGSA